MVNFVKDLFSMSHRRPFTHRLFIEIIDCDADTLYII